MAAAGAGGGGKKPPVEGWGGNVSAANISAGKLQKKSLAGAAVLRGLYQSEEALNKVLATMINSKPQKYTPENLLSAFLPNILLPSFAIQPLVKPYIVSGDKLTKNSRSIFGNTAEKIISKTGQLVSSAPVENNEENSTDTNVGFTEEESFNKSAVNNGSNSNINTVYLGSTAKYTEVSVLHPTTTGQFLHIHETIEDAVTYIFNKGTLEEKSKIENYPIYFIAAFPRTNRHLTLLVFFKGILYSCGVGAAGEPKTEGEAATLAASLGAGAAAPVASTGAAASGGLAFGFTEGIASAFAAKQGGPHLRQVSAFTQQAMLVSPDFLYKGTQESRIFHMGILTPEHLEKLKAHFPTKNRSIIINFKKVNLDSHIIGYKFFLDQTFSLTAFPGTGYINCTVFILNIFGEKIKCPNYILGRALPDPSQCIIRSLRDIVYTTALYDETTEFYTNLNKIIAYIRHNASRTLTQVLGFVKGDYLARDAYIVYLLARFIRNYMLGGEDPRLIHDLTDPLSAAAAGGAAAGGAAAANMTNEGGRRRLRRKRQTRKRKTKAYRQPLKRRATKRQ